MRSANAFSVLCRPLPLLHILIKHNIVVQRYFIQMNYFSFHRLASCAFNETKKLNQLFWLLLVQGTTFLCIFLPVCSGYKHKHKKLKLTKNLKKKKKLARSFLFDMISEILSSWIAAAAAAKNHEYLCWLKWVTLDNNFGGPGFESD